MVSGSLQVVARGLASEIAGYFVHVASGPLVTTSDPFLLPVWAQHQLAGKLRAASALRRRPTPGAVYLVRPPWHPPPTAPGKWPHVRRVTRWARLPSSWASPKWRISSILPLEEARPAHWFKLAAHNGCSADCLKFEPGACRLPMQGYPRSVCWNTMLGRFEACEGEQGTRMSLQWGIAGFRPKMELRPWSTACVCHTTALAWPGLARRPLDVVFEMIWEARWNCLRYISKHFIPW